jgi:hypothetical protein
MMAERATSVNREEASGVRDLEEASSEISFFVALF